MKLKNHYILKKNWRKNLENKNKIKLCKSEKKNKLKRRNYKIYGILYHDIPYGQHFQIGKLNN